MIQTAEGLEITMAKVEMANLVGALVNAGALSEQAAIGYFLDLAQIVRDLEVSPGLRPYADGKALHYEDMANLMRGGGLLSRDPT